MVYAIRVQFCERYTQWRVCCRTKFAKKTVSPPPHPTPRQPFLRSGVRFISKAHAQEYTKTSHQFFGASGLQQAHTCELRVRAFSTIRPQKKPSCLYTNASNKKKNKTIKRITSEVYARPYIIIYTRRKKHITA